MITLSLSSLQRIAANRPACYLDDVLSGASVEGDRVLITRERYEQLKIKYRQSFGPGTELKKLLKTIGIEAKPGCKCNKRAQEMDERGCDWCAENIDLIASWLQEEAERRGIPYVSIAGKLLIKAAIRRARAGNKKQGD